MTTIDPEFLDKTVAFWQPRTSRKLTREDARQMIENVTGFFKVLAEWDAKARIAQAASEPRPESPPND